jgi:hypothetical protein
VIGADRYPGYLSAPTINPIQVLVCVCVCVRMCVCVCVYAHACNVSKKKSIPTERELFIGTHSVTSTPQWTSHTYAHRHKRERERE